MSKSPTLFSSDDEDEERELEEKLLKKFQKMLHGIPPPSTITLSKLTASEILAKYKENINLIGTNETTFKSSRRNQNKTPLVYYHNSSKVSEDIAYLSQKVVSRYVYFETMSSCNIWFDSSLPKNNVLQQQSRKYVNGKSPGSRLSHLAKKKRLFSLENLQKLEDSSKKHIIEIEKPNMNKRSFISNCMVEFEKRNSFKKALFVNSDDDDDEKEEGPKPKRFFSSQQEIISNKTMPINNYRQNWFSQFDNSPNILERRRPNRIKR
ncbi:hypothetical protein Phum_PHUM200120 [Pediculus humanus corporis]|uniref:Uncharacterized protein n=1 Tax=Pediculus humanus subsp. corporis TaxID=121224 RepID=E0VH32_PEDHC|nr:uncharacterized protein Phum_PHUM200120 [Pediculus humanus corporis]EEB12688.1 hypothetical protein Phum_PHUM200120 [Pediculus humanus corporis]